EHFGDVEQVGSFTGREVGGLHGARIRGGERVRRGCGRERRWGRGVGRWLAAQCLQGKERQQRKPAKRQRGILQVQAPGRRRGRGRGARRSRIGRRGHEGQ